MIYESFSLLKPNNTIQRYIYGVIWYGIIFATSIGRMKVLGEKVFIYRAFVIRNADANVS